MRPAVGCSKPAIMRRQVVLPEPDGPSSEKNSPACTDRFTCSTAVTEPNRLLTSTSATSSLVVSTNLAPPWQWWIEAEAYTGPRHRPRDPLRPRQTRAWPRPPEPRDDPSRPPPWRGQPRPGRVLGPARSVLGGCRGPARAGHRSLRLACHRAARGPSGPAPARHRLRVRRDHPGAGPTNRRGRRGRRGRHLGRHDRRRRRPCRDSPREQRPVRRGRRADRRRGRPRLRCRLLAVRRHVLLGPGGRVRPRPRRAAAGRHAGLLLLAGHPLQRMDVPAGDRGDDGDRHVAGAARPRASPDPSRSPSPGGSRRCSGGPGSRRSR